MRPLLQAVRDALDGTRRGGAVGLAAGALVLALAELLVLHSLHQVIDAHRSSSSTAGQAVLFFGALLVAWTRSGALSVQCADTFDAMARAFTERTLRLFTRLPLAHFDTLDRADVFHLYAEDAEKLRTFGSDFGTAFIATVTAVVAAGYLVAMEPWAGVAVFGWMVAIAIDITLRISRLRAELRAARAERAAVFDACDDIIRGFRQVRLHAARSRALGVEIERASRRLHDGLGNALVGLQNGRINQSIVPLVLLGAIGFGLPLFGATSLKAAAFLVVVVLFVMPYVQAIVSAMPGLAEVAESFERLTDFERWLAARAEGDVETIALRPGPLTLRGVTFAYPSTIDQPGFSVGPVDLTVGPGEVVFVVGHNGSGKSTLLKVLAGLYDREAGAIELGGVAVPARPPPAYREQFAVVFAEFVLFDALHAVDPIDPHAVARALADMGLEGIVGYREGRFAPLDLSTGQRRRLEMVRALLEDRPFLIFDEWAADQDPGSRARFYRSLVPALTAQGKAVVVISHDDQYFDCADRVVTLSAGRMVVS